MKPSLKRVLEALDNKEYEFYDNLEEEDRPSIYPLLKWCANVEGEKEVGFLLKASRLADEHFFNLPPSMQWRVLCIISIRKGKWKHFWI